VKVKEVSTHATSTRCKSFGESFLMNGCRLLLLAQQGGWLLVWHHHWLESAQPSRKAAGPFGWMQRGHFCHPDVPAQQPAGSLPSPAQDDPLFNCMIDSKASSNPKGMREHFFTF